MQQDHIKRVHLEQEVVVPIQGSEEKFLLIASLVPQRDRMYVSIGLSYLVEQADSSLPVVSGVVSERAYSTGGKFSINTVFEQHAFNHPELAAALLFQIVPEAVVALLKKKEDQVQELLVWHTEMIETRTFEEGAQLTSDDGDDNDYGYDDDEDETEEERSTIFRPEAEVKYLLRLLMEAQKQGFQTDVAGLITTFSREFLISDHKPSQALD